MSFLEKINNKRNFKSVKNEFSIRFEEDWFNKTFETLYNYRIIISEEKEQQDGFLEDIIVVGCGIDCLKNITLEAYEIIRGSDQVIISTPYQGFIEQIQMINKNVILLKRYFQELSYPAVYQKER